MQSPDITDISQCVPPPDPALVGSVEKRRSARRRGGGVEQHTPTTTDHGNTPQAPPASIASSDAPPETAPTRGRGRRRGRGRGRGAGGGRKAQAQGAPEPTREPQSQPQPRGRGGRRGRIANKAATEQHLPPPTDIKDVKEDSAIVPTVTEVEKKPEAMDCDDNQPSASLFGGLPSSSSSLFSSVLKSEPGGGIPGLDLDDCEANSATFSVEVTTPHLNPPQINLSFGGTSGLTSNIEQECKHFQQLQIEVEKLLKADLENKIGEPSTTPTATPTATAPATPTNQSAAATPAQSDNNEADDSSKVRRSSRIKTMEEQRGPRARRREVVLSISDSPALSRSNVSLQEDDSNSNGSSYPQTSSGYSSPSRDSCGSGNGGVLAGSSSSAQNLSLLTSGLQSQSQDSGGGKPYKVKQRWRNSLDVESSGRSSFSFSGDSSSISSGGLELTPSPSLTDLMLNSDKMVRRKGHLVFDGSDEELLEKLKKFDGIDESVYRTEKKMGKENKDKGMVCDCYLSREEIAQGEVGCTEDCLNRLLMVECGNKCPTGPLCSNKRFQRKEYASLEVFKTEKKGHGLRTLQAIPEGGFVIEYVGEVLDFSQFERRTTEYAKGNQEHFYFMALKSDAYIDATCRGNCSRFINHSCEPNCETQKWTVNGEVRIGFFAIKHLQPGDEITFDYQFERYGKKAQRCYCMTESCRGWIGGDDEDDGEADLDDHVDDKEEELAAGVEDSKAKPKPKVEKKKRKNVQLEDMAFREELHKLEQSGLKNRTHTLTLSRLMVRAESWDDRERLLKILINGDSPCRRLFLDYHGLRLIWSWMVDLPLPHESEGPQLIRNDIYHKLFLKALQSLPIPNKSMLMESKVLSLVEKWCTVPSVTTTVTLVKRDAFSEVKKADEPKSSSDDSQSQSQPEDEKMDTSEPEPKIEPTSPSSSTTRGATHEEVREERKWEFVPISKVLLESWSDLKEVFKIPKKERVEQMKEHEREADKGQPGSGSSLSTSGFGSSGYGNNHRNKQYRIRGERRVPVLDTTLPQFQRERHVHTQPNRMNIPPGVSKEEWRKHFEESMKVKEQQDMMRKQQDALVILHQERCNLVGMDPATTPIVDPNGVYYLDPKTVEWKAINSDDPSMPPELIKFVQLSQHPPQQPPQPEEEPPVEEPIQEPEQAFPPWPQGLPPPPPLPPKELPRNWKMNVDIEGRCYYYHVKTKATQWYPPSMEDESPTSSSESSSEEEVEEEIEEEKQGSPVITKSNIITWRTKLLERAARRKKSGLVQERIISPRAEEDKGFSKQMVKQNKKEVYEEKMARLKLKESGLSESETEVQFQLQSDKDDTTASEFSDTDTSGHTSDSSASSSVSLPKSKPQKIELKKKVSTSMSWKKGSSRDRDKQHKPSGSSSSKDHSKSKPKEKPTETKPKSGDMESSSPIETELDLTLSQLEDEQFFSKPRATPTPPKPPHNQSSSRIIGSTPSMDVVEIPGLGFDIRDLDAKKKAERAARHAAKKKQHALQKKSKEKSSVVEAPSGAGNAGPASAVPPPTPDKRMSSKEASSIKDAFRNSIASIVVGHLNPYRKTHIRSTDDFKHLARKITHAILLKELKHTRNVASLEVTDSVKHKTKEYIRKFMARYPNGVYVRSPENSQSN